ncbi:DUF6270 domain-containing protein, partial [Halomonas sp. 3D7M]|uniref:DUF6270 domain-containing protein n=1 Tax=Halomonas sp. 3D7M TaxID=2742617 RepID=UPI00186933FF
MDDLLNHAQRLASQTSTPIAQPVEGRIAYVVSHGQSYASNGYAIRTQGIAKALNDHGLEALCFVRPGRPWELQQAPMQIEPETTLEGVRYIHTRWLKGEVPQGDAAHMAASVKRLVTLFRIYRPSAVLAASNWICGLPAWVAAKQLGLPFYSEVRGFWELSREAREPGYCQQPAFKQEAERDTFVTQQAQGVFTLNAPMKAELVNRGVEKSRIGIVPNAVSVLPEIKPAPTSLKNKLGIADNEKVVGYIGSFSPYEGLDLLLDACTELVQSGEKLKLLLVGDSQPLTLKYESLKNNSGASAADIADTGLKETPPWLIQVGRVPHERVADYYALLDAVVIPRKKLPVCELVPPMKAAEALAYGKRLVVSDVAPLAEYAANFDGVVSFEAGSAASLATALQRSLKLPAPKQKEPEAIDITSKMLGSPSVLIFGSCVSRDAISPMIGSSVELSGYYARSSLGSISSPSFVDGSILENITSPFQKRMVRYDMDKSIISAVERNGFDVLVIDLIDERFNLVQCGSGLATLSTEHARGLKGKKPKGLVNAYSEKKMQLWKRGVDRLASAIGKGLGFDRVVLNKVYWTNHLDSEGGRKIEKVSDEQVSRANGFLQEMYTYLEEKMPGVNNIEYGEGELVADENHKWGVSAFHYGERYEAKFREALTSIFLKLGLLSPVREEGGKDSYRKYSQANSSMLMFAHVEPMVKALKREQNPPTAVGTKPVKLRDVSQVDYATASQWFYRQGNLTDTLRALESLQARGVKFDKPKRDFQAFVAGMARLKGGWPLPPRQPNAGLMSRRQHVLYCLHQSVPHATNGYSTRS